MDNYNITGWEILTDNKILLIEEINEKKENDVILNLRNMVVMY